jgi:hypothetical protein
MHFGGGFEIGAITQNGAEKVGDALNLFWRYDPNRSKVPLLEPVMIKWDYVGDDLIVQRLAQQRHASGAFELKEHIVSVIAPPDRPPVFAASSVPDLNCRYLCATYYAVDKHNMVRTTSFIFHAGDRKEGPLRFRHEGDKLRMDFDLEHYAKEWDLVKDALG